MSDEKIQANQPYEVKQQKKAIEAVKKTSFGFNKVCLLILTLLAIFYTLHFAASIILPFVLALVLNLLFAPLMRFFHKRAKLPKPLAAIFLIIVLFVVVSAIGTAISVPAARWIAKIPDSLPILEAKLSILKGPVHILQDGYNRLQFIIDQKIFTETPRLQPSIITKGNSSELLTLGSSVLSGTGELLFEMFTMLILLFFLLAEGDSLLWRVVEIMPTVLEKKRLIHIVGEIERNVSIYLVTITIMNILVGLANMIQCWVLGMPNPLLWGVLAFLLNYIPIIGPGVGIVIYFFVGLFAFPTLLMAFIPPLIYFFIHLVEGETLTPMLLAKRFTLNPVMVMASLMFWDWLWGISGAFLSLPMLAVLKILCDNINFLTPIGHILGGPAQPTSLRTLVKGR
ncbi:AI-2E family transporter [Entomobacter blattae]|uniref:Transport protein YhhT n=1 Tax=Entomobacter blattae TaxID=2762277 RepID=A0A7H1NPR4_9PROT|nr:AI-2E family transporter [Entomobacter blattae]QNT77774.1 Putative transport protein YhhT [Entomobacter blattae]